MSLKLKMIQYPNSKEFVRYFWAGGLATLADFAVLLLLTEVFGIPEGFAPTIHARIQEKLARDTRRSKPR